LPKCAASAERWSSIPFTSCGRTAATPASWASSFRQSPPGLINKGNKQAELHAGIVVGKHDIVLEKPRYGAFHGTDLDPILRNRGVDTVIITGICTNVCCETTAREANMRDYKVFFVSDATATFNTPEASADQIQPIVLATLKAAFAQIENTASMIRKLQEQKSAAAA
jgi:nicotinamidase-related amidase